MRLPTDLNYHTRYTADSAQLCNLYICINTQ